jgi:hypothetical protein
LSWTLPSGFFAEKLLCMTNCIHELPWDEKKANP